MIKASEKQVEGIWSGMLYRKRYIDDKVVIAVSGVAVDGNSVDVIINLGAGYDTHVYQLSALATVPAWEVDQPVNIEAKEKGVKKALGRILALVTLLFNGNGRLPLRRIRSHIEIS
ncbi:MAG: hypothetical protein GY796_11115 [Chloroflexi bacterium]|nr:hypothetical protein [Chloroflexota bacterium]